jgi:guanylate kinase
VGRGEFEDRIEQGGFLEWASYQGQLYGTPLPPPDSELDLLLVIEVQGARQVLERIPGAVMILVVPPSSDAQEARLRARGDSEEHVQRRLRSAEEEEHVGRGLAHHVVVNDDLNRAVDEVTGILARHRPLEGA